MPKIRAYVSSSDLEKLSDEEWALIYPATVSDDGEKKNLYMLEFDPTDPNVRLVSVSGKSEVKVKIVKTKAQDT